MSTISAAPPALTRRTRRFGRGERRTAWMMVSPTILVVLLVALIPVLDTIWLSLHHSTVVHAGSFAGLSNFSAIFSDPAFRKALLNSGIFTVASVAIELVLGLAVALTLNRRFRGRGFLRAAVLIPWAFPLSIAAVIARLLLQDQGGVLAYLAHQLGLTHSPILANPTSLLISIILVDVWTSTPFMALLILAGLQTIPQDVLEAATVDGATPVQSFFRITLPLLKPAILVALLFRTLQAWAAYDLFWVIAQHQIDSLSTYVYQGVSISELEFAPGTAAAVFIFASSLLIALVYIKFLGARRAQEA